VVFVKASTFTVTVSRWIFTSFPFNFSWENLPKDIYFFYLFLIHKFYKRKEIPLKINNF